MIAGSLFATFHLWATWPVFSAPARLIPGWEGDNMMFLWNLWWVGQDGWALGRCGVQYAPDGLPFLFHTHTWLYGQLLLIVRPVLDLLAGRDPFGGLVLGYNLLMLWASVASGLALVALCRMAGLRRWPVVLLLSLAVTFCHARLFAMYGHLNLVGTEFLFWAITVQSWAAFRAKGSVRAWALAGVLTALAFLNDQTYGVFAGLFWIVLALCQRIGRQFTAGDLGRAAAAFWGSFLGLAALHLAPLAMLYGSADFMVASAFERRVHDVANLLLPSDYHWLAGSKLHALRTARGIDGGDGVGYVGWGLSAGAALLLLRGRRLRADLKDPFVRLWLVVGVLGLLCVLSEWLTVGGRMICPLPYRVTRLLPVVDNIRVPERYILFVLLAAMLAAGHGLEEAWRRWGRAAWGIWVAVVLIVLLEARFLPVVTDVGAPPYRLDDATVHAIAERGGAVWVLPAAYVNYRASLWQIQHGQPIVFGTHARIPHARVEAAFAEAPFLKSLLDPANWPADRVLAEDHADSREAAADSVAAFLQARGVRTLLIAPGAENQWDRLSVFAAEEELVAAGVVVQTVFPKSS
ncbi:MAG: hypothetical protein RLY93_03955 [Sumerlaeia bacterium]